MRWNRSPVERFIQRTVLWLSCLLECMCLLTALAVQEKVSGPWIRHQGEKLRVPPKFLQGITSHDHRFPPWFFLFSLVFLLHTCVWVHQVLQYKKKCDDLEGDFGDLKSQYDSVRMVRFFLCGSRDGETSLHASRFFLCHSFIPAVCALESKVLCLSSWRFSFLFCSSF